MSIAAILSSGVPVQADLLLELPDTSDPFTWPRVPFAAETILSAVPTIQNNSPVLIGSVTFPLTPKLDASVTVRAFGLRYQGQTLCVGACAPFYLADGFPVTFTVTFVVYPWSQ